MPEQDRVQVGPLSGPDRLRPGSNIVDTFAAPIVRGPANGSNALDVANALMDIKPELRQFIGDREYEVTKDDIQAGAALRVKNQKDFKSAVSQGLIPAGASPWFRKGYQRQDLRLKAQEYDAGMKQGYFASSARNSDKPEDLQTFVSNYTNDWIKKSGVQDNPEFNDTFAPLMAHAQSELTAQHSHDRILAYEQGAKEGLFQIVQQTAEGRDLMGPEATARAITNFAAEQYHSGMDGTTVNKITTDGIIQKATADGDLDALNLLDHVETGSGKLGATQYAKEEREKAESQIMTSNRQRSLYDSTVGKQIKDEQLGEIQQAALGKMFADPSADLGDEIKRMAAIDPEKASEHARDLISTRTAMMQTRQSDKNALIELRAGVSLGTTSIEDVKAAARAGLISSDDGTRLLDDFDKAKANKDINTDPTLTKMHGDMLKVIMDPNNYSFDKAQDSMKASRDFMEGMYQFKEANPKATSKDLRKEAQELQDQLIKVYGSTSDAPQPTEPTKALPTVKAFKSKAALDHAGASTKGGTYTELDRLAEKYGVKPEDIYNSQYQLFSAEDTPTK